MKPKPFEIIVEFTPQSTKTGITYEAHKKGSLIRCKDCKYAKKIYIKNLPWAKQWEYSCAHFDTHSVMGDGFCSYAERKETEQ